MPTTRLSPGQGKCSHQVPPCIFHFKIGQARPPVPFGSAADKVACHAKSSSPFLNGQTSETWLCRTSSMSSNDSHANLTCTVELHCYHSFCNSRQKGANWADGGTLSMQTEPKAYFMAELREADGYFDFKSLRADGSGIYSHACGRCRSTTRGGQLVEASWWTLQLPTAPDPIYQRRRTLTCAKPKTSYVSEAAFWSLLLKKIELP